MDDNEKITTGLNDRPRNETIAQTGGGLPDDSSRAVDVDDATVERARAKLEENTSRQTLKDDVEEQEDKPYRGSA